MFLSELPCHLVPLQEKDQCECERAEGRGSWGLAGAKTR